MNGENIIVFQLVVYYVKSICAVLQSCISAFDKNCIGRRVGLSSFLKLDIYLFLTFAATVTLT